MEREVIYQPIETIKLTEPRIEFFKRSIENLLKVVDLEKDGKIVKVDAFRLKNLTDWEVPFVGDPATIFQNLARKCNLRCKFCYLIGNPGDAAISSEHQSTIEELRTRLKYYNPQKRKELFSSMYAFNELFCHPNAIEYLQKIRKKTKKPFTIVTNGSFLTEDLIKKISRLKPVLIIISLNSRDIGKRRALMNDKNPEIAINASKFLNKYKVHYGISIAPWPPLDKEDIKNTLIHAADNNASFIRVVLPGHTKYFSRKKLFDTKRIWSEIVSIVNKIRRTVDTPIYCIPSVYEIDHFYKAVNQAVILGVIRESPAFRAKIRSMDRIISINGYKIKNRDHADNLLQYFKNDRKCSIVVKREGKRGLLRSNIVNRASYPAYMDIEGLYDFPFGIIMPGGFSLSYLNDIEQTIRQNSASHVLIFCSKLMLPSVLFEMEKRDFINRIKRDHGALIKIMVPRNRYLGGNIFTGNMLVADDFIKEIRSVQSKGRFKPDLVLIPSAPFEIYNNWLKDMRGDSFLKIERNTGVKTELIECKIIGY